MARISAASLVAPASRLLPLATSMHPFRSVLLSQRMKFECQDSKLDKISTSAIEKKNNPVIKVIYFIVAESEPRCPDS